MRGTTAGLCSTCWWSCWCCCGGSALPGECSHGRRFTAPAAPLTVCLFILSTGFGPAASWRPWLHSNGVLLAVVVVVALLSLVVLLLLGSHLYLISRNTTTWEFMARHRISYLRHCGADENPFDRGPAHNLWGFFCVWGTVVWEQVYFREGSNQV